MVESDKYLSLKIEGDTLNIPLTEDKPKEVKKVFNQLILHLKKGPLEFSMEEEKGGDIIYSVAKEYITQLNTDLDETYQELKANQLLDQ